MKTIRLFTLAAMVLLAAMPLMAVNTIMYTATYDKSPQLGTDTLGGVTYSTVAYEGLYNGGDPGMPSLPVDYIKFSVPYNAVNFTVSTLLRNTFIYNVPHLLYPCQEPVPTDGSEPQGITLPDSAAYFSNTTFPSQQAWVVDEGFLAGENHIVTVAVMPISYYHGSGSNAYNRVKVSETVRLTLRYELNDSTAPAPLIRQDSVLRQEGYELTQSLVANPGNVVANAPVMMTMDSTLVFNPLSGGDGLNGGDQTIGPGIGPGENTGYGGQLQEADHNVPYLIVTTNELYHSMRRLAALKRQKGYNVHIVTMDQVMNDPYASIGDLAQNRQGTYEVAYNDSAGVLREFLKNTYRYNGLKYVFLVGNVPYRYAYKWSGFELTDSLPSDLYFSDLNGFWSSDGLKNKCDRHPDLSVGRLLAYEKQHVRNYTDKLMRYELNPGNGDYNYLKRILYSVGESFQNHGILKSVNKYYRTCFPDSTTFLENSINMTPSGTDIVNSLNNSRCGYISFMNHGDPAGLILCNNGSVRYMLWAIDSIHLTYDNIIYTLDHNINNGFNNIDNKSYPNICYSVGCTTMPFDQAPHYEAVTINCGMSFTVGQDYGGPAFLGNTREGYVGGSNTLEEYFAKCLSQGYYHIGKAEAVSKSLLIDNNVCRVHNLLGDPEFEVWTDVPSLFSNINIIRADSTIHISGITADSVLVSMYSNDGTITKKIASSDITFNNVSPNNTVMIYKHNYIPYIAPLILQNGSITKSQYIIAKDVIAGNSVDTNRSFGSVNVKSGVEYEIEASGTVTLQDGFKVEKGATFAVYPACF